MSVVGYRGYSVLMSVYHKEKPEYLKQAIESIQMQTLATDDFVLVCDGPLNESLDSVIAAKQQEVGESLHVTDLQRTVDLAMHSMKASSIVKMSWLLGWTAMTSLIQIDVKNRLLCLTHIRK